MTDLQWPMSCPFCGGWPVLAPIGNKGLCDARGPPKLIPGEAMEAWDQIHFRRRMTDRDLRPGDDDDGPRPEPKPVAPKLPEMV